MAIGAVCAWALLVACSTFAPPARPATVTDVEAGLRKACDAALLVCNLDEFRPNRSPRDVQTCADARAFCVPAADGP